MLILCLLLAIAHIHGLDSKSINFGLAFPQADKNADMFGWKFQKKWIYNVMNQTDNSMSSNLMKTLQIETSFK